MFTLQETPINTIQLKNSHTASSDGAFVNFEGIVRADEIQGAQVSSLLYVANGEECLKEGEKIVKESLSLFPIAHALCVQRIGQLNVGETAIWIGVWSGHRDEAFKACRYIIEEVKKRLLIWKKENLNNGSSLWAHGKESPVIQ